MSPLKITLLLDLYTRGHPMQDYPPAQQTAPAMREAFFDFEKAGLLVPGVTLAGALVGMLPGERLSPKGLDLFQRICALQP